MSGTQTGFLENLRDAARENPLAAALIGGGAFWLLMGNERLKGAAGSVSAASASLADIGNNLRSNAAKFTKSPPTAPEMDEGSSQHFADTARNAKSVAADGLSTAAGAITDRFEESATSARENFGKLGGPLPGKETIAQVQSTFSDLLQKQPLLLGAIGLAVGAAVAGAFSASDLENEWVGEFSDTVKEDLNARVGAVSQSVREASDTLTAEADDIGTETLERLHEAGRSGVNAIREGLASPSTS
jgi:hypothetical protein